MKSILIDIRDNYEYQKYHLPNSVNVPFAKLIINPDKYLDKNTSYLLICEYGFKSKKTVEILKKAGYLVDSLSGGIKAKRHQ